MNAVQDDARSVTGTVRVDTRKREFGALDMEIEGERGLNLENELSAADGLGEAFDLTPSMLALRATKMFTERCARNSFSETRKNLHSAKKCRILAE